jgi:hypothetical protein
MKFKYKKTLDRLPLLHPATLYLMTAMNMMFYDAGYPFVVTDGLSTLEEDKKLKRKHATHRTGRAFDVSVKNIPDDFIEQVIEYFNAEFKSEAAYSESRGELALIIDHKGTNRHLHVQIHARYSLDYSDIVLK